MTQLRIGEDKRIVSIITNECEHLNVPGPAGVLQHAALDVAVARMAAKLGCHVAMGTYAVGNPDITQPAIVKALRDGYADWWNNGYAQTGIRPVWDQHEYSPDEKHIYNTWEGYIDFASPTYNSLIAAYSPNVSYETVGRNNTRVSRINPVERTFITTAMSSVKSIYMYEQDWHETRATFLFKLCGFNLKSGGVLMSSETGIDKGGYGGFVGCGLGSADVVKWVQRFRQIWARPVTDDFGNTCPAPKESANLFQGTDDQNGSGHWGSYYVGNMQDALAMEWGK